MTKAKELTKSHVTIVSAKLGLSYEEKQIVLILFNTKNWMKAVEIAKSMEIASSAGGITRIINTAIGKHGNFILKRKGWGQPNTYRFNTGFFIAEANKFEGPIKKKSTPKEETKVKDSPTMKSGKRQLTYYVCYNQTLKDVYPCQHNEKDEAIIHAKEKAMVGNGSEIHVLQLIAIAKPPAKIEAVVKLL